MAKTVVVLGGSYAGLQIAHKLLKGTRQNVKDLKVILVSKNSHFYWNMASVRHIVPGVLKDEELFQAIAPGFSSYPADSFEFIVGTAEKVDTDAKTVLVVALAGEQKTLAYDQLVLATGTRCAGNDHVPWKAEGSYDEVLDLLHKTQEKVKAAKHIVVAGAGATGVETAAELGFEFKDKEIVLLSGAGNILGGDSIASNAEAELKKLGVKIQTNARVTGSTTLPDGKTEISLQSGDKITTDVYLPTIGVTPNTEYLDTKHLRSDKYVDIDQFYKVKGTENVWAAGDIVCKPRPGFVITEKQAAGVATNLDRVLKGQAPTPVKEMPIDIFVCATGRSRTAGRLGPVKILSIMGWLAKGKTLGVQRVGGYVSGSAF